MKETKGDLWTYEPCDCRVITTNMTVTRQGMNVMGGGCAGEAAARWPELPALYAMHLMHGGNGLTHMGLCAGKPLVCLPTKWQVWMNSSLDLIVPACEGLVKLADRKGWQDVVMARPGAGLGGLRWDDVCKAIAPILDDRFTAIDYDQR